MGLPSAKGLRGATLRGSLALGPPAAVWPQAATAPHR